MALLSSVYDMLVQIIIVVSSSVQISLPPGHRSLPGVCMWVDVFDSTNPVPFSYDWAGGAAARDKRRKR